MNGQCSHPRLLAALVARLNILTCAGLPREVRGQSPHQAEEEHVEGPQHGCGSQETEGEEKTRPQINLTPSQCEHSFVSAEIGFMSTSKQRCLFWSPHPLIK